MTAARGPLSIVGFWRCLPTDGRWLLATVAAGSLGRGLVSAFTVIYLHEVRGMDLRTAGAMVAVAAVAAVLVTALGGPAIDRFGARVTLIAVQLFAIAGNLLLAFSGSVASAALAFSLLGAAFGLSWPSQNTMASSIVSGQVREVYFGVNFAMVNLGIGAGGVISGLVIDVDRLSTFQTMFVADAALLCVPLAVLLGPLRHVPGRVRGAAGGVRTPGGYGPLLQDRALRWVLAMAFVFGIVGYGQFEAGMPMFARQVSEVSTFVIGLGFGANTGIIVLLQFAVMRRLVGRRRTRALVAASVLWAASWALFALTGPVAGTAVAATGVVVALGLFGVGEALMQPTSSAMVNDLAPPEMRGRYNAAFSSASQLAVVLAPILTGVLLHDGHAMEFAAGLVLLSLAYGGLALRVERLLPAGANGGGAR